MRSNCLLFALALLWWRWLRWRKDLSRPEPYLIVRPSRSGGPCHVLVGTRCADGRLRVVSYKPIKPKKPAPVHAIGFKGRVARGD